MTGYPILSFPGSQKLIPYDEDTYSTCTNDQPKCLHASFLFGPHCVCSAASRQLIISSQTTPLPSSLLSLPLFLSSPSPSLFLFSGSPVLSSSLPPPTTFSLPSVFIALFSFALSGLLQYASSGLPTTLPSFSLWLAAFEIQLITTAQLYLCF